jgi:hypothetical protein
LGIPPIPMPGIPIPGMPPIPPMPAIGSGTELEVGGGIVPEVAVLAPAPLAVEV